MATQLQLALDFVELDDALALLAKVHADVDIIEVGTPTIIRYGVEAVRQVKQVYPQKQVLADLKVMDAGEGEAQLAFAAGADIVTVLGVAHDETIQGSLRAAARCRGQIMADLMCVAAVEQRAAQLEQFGCQALCLHTATDAPGSGGDRFHQVRLLRTRLSQARIAVAGGIDAGAAQLACEAGAHILVVGGAIVKAADPGEAARVLHQICAGSGTIEVNHGFFSRL